MNTLLHTATTALEVAGSLTAGLIPDPAPAAPPGGEAIASTVLGWLKWGALIFGAAMLIIGLIMNMRSNKRGEASEGQETIIRVLISVGGVSAAVGLITVVWTAAQG